MRMWSIAAICIAACLGSCTIHPLPQDVTGLNTQLIVRQIRCESRAAVIEIGYNWLMQRDEETKTIAKHFHDNPSEYKHYNYNLFKGETRKILQLFFDTGIAYNYKLTMTETNGLAASLDLVQPYLHGTGTFGIGGSASLQRQNLRTFTITDSFSKLIRDLSDEECSSRIANKNFVYPIAGEIGMVSIIHDFVHLTLFDRLGGDGKNGQGPPTLVDSLDFQTTFSVNGAPKFVFTPVGRSLTLTDATLGPSASRSDLHNVTVGLALPSTGRRLAEALRGTGVTPLLLSAQGGPSELAAAKAVNQVVAQRALSPIYLLGQ